MKAQTRILAAVITGASLFALAGCSLDTLLWGQDGAAVIGSTEKLIDAAASDEQRAYACEDFTAGFGASTAWDGLGAGEPEKFDGESSVDRPSLDAHWRINLEGGSSGALPGDAVPTDVFYRQTAEGLCVADVIWWTGDD